MNRIGITSATFLLWCAAITAAQAQNLIPQPVSVEKGTGTLMLKSYPSIEFTDNKLAPLAAYLADYLPGGRVDLALDPEMELSAEGYRLDVTDAVKITGKDYGGVWNGIQTFLQLLPAEVYGKPDKHPDWTVPVVAIEDYPALPYRGVMLDVARTFTSKDGVMHLIDNISRHKINKLHWHLADDEGWRIEIKSLPRLTEIGAWRGGDSPVMPVYGAWDTKYGGFYTQDEIREVVAYAAQRNVEIIPEIDLPGHSRAAAIACPEILCDYRPSLSAGAGYDTRNVWCVAREENYAMLDSIIREVAALFPSKTLHLGGDEVMTGQWKQCPHCKALMAEHGIADAARLQDIFMSRVIEIAARHGKNAGVWNEAAAGDGIPKSATVWGWESPAVARRVAAAGYPTVVCAGEYFYFDMRQSPRDVGHIWAGVVTLEKVYSFSTEATGFSEAESTNVRGVEATLFTELGLENGPGYIDYQLFPRVCALAEVAWTPVGQRSWDDFIRRLGTGNTDPRSGSTHLDRLTAMDIKYRAAEPISEPAAPLKKSTVVFTSSLTENAKYPFVGVSNYSVAARTTAACAEGDWFMWRFADGLAYGDYREIEIKTGYDHLQRAGVPRGRIEVSYDGTGFTEIARLHDLKAKLIFVGEMESLPAESERQGAYVFLRSKIPIRALRIVCESNGNGEDFTLIQPLKIK